MTSCGSKGRDLSETFQSPYKTPSNTLAVKGLIRSWRILFFAGWCRVGDPYSGNETKLRWYPTGLEQNGADHAQNDTGSWEYRKIPKITSGTYIFQRPFLRGLFLEGLRRGLSTEGNLRFKIDWASLIVGSKFTVFALFYFVFDGNFQVQAPGGLIFGGAI